MASTDSAPAMATPLKAKPDFLAWLGPEKTAILQKLQDWPMGFVAEKLVMSGHSTPDTVDDHILWYKQFMSFKGLRPNIRCGMFSDTVDGVWHQHILYTEDYARFGAEIFGTFVHHVPCNIMDMSPEALREYGHWVTDYEEVYGHLPKDLADEILGEVSIRGPKCNGGGHPHPPGTYKCLR